MRDDELIRAWQRGDDAAFETLYRRHRDWVVNVAYRFCGNRADALDVLQETWLYVVRKRDGLTLTARFTTFLYPAVKHLALDRRKKARRHAPLDAAPEPTALAGLPPDTAPLLAGLSETQREILTLRFLDGLDLSEIAGMLKIPLGTVKSRLHHALRAARDKKPPEE
jgi:RNA polymerase sigma-70 factor (ECF subfamily)